MKQLIFVCVMIVAGAVANAKQINLKGLAAKAVYDTLGSNEKLEIFFDCAMGKCYLTTGPIQCLKNVADNAEELSCLFKPVDKASGKEVLLTNEADGVDGISNVRFVLVEASGAEKKTSANIKEVKIKELSCASFGLSHSLDSMEVEPKFQCTIKL